MEENMIEIPTPCKEEVIKYLKLWDSMENYVLQEKSLDKQGDRLFVQWKVQKIRPPVRPLVRPDSAF